MISVRRAFTAASLIGLVGVLLAAAAATGSSLTQAPGKPVIGKPVTIPAQPQAGKPFTVAFKVTKANTGTVLMAGKMICDPSIAGKVITHVESFKRGTARLSFVVPADAGSKQLKVKLTIVAGKQSATKVVTFRVQAAPNPSVSIGDVTAAEGNTGTTTFSFPVSLSAAATQTVSVAYATTDGTAVAPSDYATATGTLAFQPGEKTKPITVSVVADTVMEPSETFTITLSKPLNATLAKGTATGTITNDDTAVPVTPGQYRSSEGNWVYLTVLPNRTVTGFRTNSLTENCQPGGIRLTGAVNWGTNRAYLIASDGSFKAQGIWSGSDKQGDVEWTNESWQVSGLFITPTSASGTFALSDEINYGGTHYS